MGALDWVEPEDVAPGEASSDQYNLEVAANLRLVPRGVVAYIRMEDNVELPDDVLVAISELDVTFTAVAGRMYRLSHSFPVAIQDGGVVQDNAMQCEVFEGVTKVNSTTFSASSAAEGSVGGAVETIVTPGAGSVTYTVTLEAMTGGGPDLLLLADDITIDNHVLVEDIGSAT